MVGMKQLPENYWGLVDEAVELANKILKERGAQYNNGGISPRDYWTFGHQSIIHEIQKKTIRMISLSKAGRTDELMDSVLDIINYCRFLYAEIRIEQNEEGMGEVKR